MVLNKINKTAKQFFSFLLKISYNKNGDGIIMKKIIYLFKRIINMDFGNFKNTVKKMAIKNNRSYIMTFLDVVYCGLKYQAGYRDYELFAMDQLDAKQRKTILTRGINNSIMKKYNNPKYVDIFDNKHLFNQKYNKYLNREWLYLDGKNQEEFAKFLIKHKQVVVKPISESCGRGVEIIDWVKGKEQTIYNKLIDNKQFLIEEVATQCSELDKLHPYSINTMRIVTLKGKVVVAFLRIGNNKNKVDNFNHEGLAAPINISTGIIDYLAIDKAGNQYEKHPVTNEPILWLKIPKWTRIKKFCETVSKITPEVGYVGWDVSLNEEGPYLIEANNMPGHDIYQLPPHRSAGIGVLPIFKRIMEEKK